MREGGKQLDHDLDQYLVHGGRRRDLGIYSEATEEVFDRLEKVDKCFVVCIHAVSGLVHWDVRRVPKWNRKVTYRK